MEKNISFARAQALTQRLAALGLIRVPLTQAQGRVLREDIYAAFDTPAFDRSTMDGYAGRRVDLKNLLSVIETIIAGRNPQKKITKNQCAKIMTGAPMPQGADCVAPIEQIKSLDGQTVFCNAAPLTNNIQYAGTDIKKGTLFLKKGKVLRSQDIAVLAATGNFKPLVSRAVRIGIIVSGNELVEPFSKKGKNKIFNSNAYQFYAQAQSLGCGVKYYGIAKDDLKAIVAILRRAKKENDLLLICGGVSMGDYDFVPQAVAAAGFKIIFHKIKIRPGKPLLFAKSEKCFCFGVPGNPVSAFVVFETLIKEFILKLQGADLKKNSRVMTLAKTIIRREAKHLSWMPVSFDKNNAVSPVKYYGSGHLSVLLKAQGLLEFPSGVLKLNKGAKVNVRPI